VDHCEVALLRGHVTLWVLCYSKGPQVTQSRNHKCLPGSCFCWQPRSCRQSSPSIPLL